MKYQFLYFRVKWVDLEASEDDMPDHQEEDEEEKVEQFEEVTHNYKNQYRTDNNYNRQGSR